MEIQNTVQNQCPQTKARYQVFAALALEYPVINDADHEAFWVELRKNCYKTEVVSTPRDPFYASIFGEKNRQNEVTVITKRFGYIRSQGMPHLGQDDYRFRCDGFIDHVSLRMTDL